MRQYKTTANFKIDSIRELTETEVSEFIEKQPELYSVATRHVPSGSVQNQPKQPDLLYFDATYVSEGENLNDDVFLAEELIPAISSIPNKPADWEHDSNKIIGHLLESIVTDKEGNPVAPKKNATFDIRVKGVVYKWLFPTEAYEVIQGAEKDRMFVSMEVWFDKFDYKIGDEIISRTRDNSQELDGSLKSFGGSGVHKGQRIRRVLRDMLFGGMGFVRYPANPTSIIHDVGSVGNAPDFIITDAPPLSWICVQSFSSPIELLQEKINKDQESGVLNNDKGKNKMDEAKLKELEIEIAKLRATLDEGAVAHKVEVEKITKELDAAKAATGSAIAAHANCDATVKELAVRAETAESEIEKILKEYRLASRSVKIKELFTLSDDQYKKLMDIAVEYTDEEFDAWVSNLVELSKAVKRTEPVKEVATDKGAAVASVLDAADKVRVTAGNSSSEKDKVAVAAKFLMGSKEETE